MGVFTARKKKASKYKCLFAPEILSLTVGELIKLTNFVSAKRYCCPISADILGSFKHVEDASKLLMVLKQI